MNSKAGAWVGASVLAVASQAMGQQAVEWKKSDGGNGHWYQLVYVGSAISFELARSSAQHVGADLAVIPSDAANTWVFNHLVDNPSIWFGGSIYGGVCRHGPWIGLMQLASAPDFRDPDGGWYWVNGAPATYSNWATSNHPCEVQPARDECVAGGTWFAFYYCPVYGSQPNGCNGPTDTWGASPNWYSANISYIQEWSADCNGDGIVDYGQILSGELLDANGNGVPDCCEDGTICTPSLIVNASLESGSPLNACASESVSAGNLVASGWQVTAGTVDRIRGGSACATSTQPKFGDYCLDLCGTPASSGAIKQLVPTVPGHKYRCTFWLSGDASAGPSAKKVHAKVGDYIDLSYTFNCSGSGAQAWVMNQFEFTARGANEALAFVADNGVTTGGPMLDSINLVDITTQCVGDLDASGQVDGADIALVLLNFGDCPVGP